MPRRVIQDERGYAMSFWAVFLATVLVPLIVLAWDVGRLFYARGELQKAADAAALAAVREVDIPHYLQTGEVRLTSSAPAYARGYALLNSHYLRRNRIVPSVTNIVVDDDRDAVYVAIQADVSPLFPEFLHLPPASVWGEAEVRLQTR